MKDVVNNVTLTYRKKIKLAPSISPRVHIVPVPTFPHAYQACSFHALVTSSRIRGNQFDRKLYSFRLENWLLPPTSCTCLFVKIILNDLESRVDGAARTNTF